MNVRADAVVVGTGAGGAPAAAVLAEAGLRVVMVEAGPLYRSGDFTGDEGEMTARLWKMQLAGDSGLAVYGGACVGGSTVINDAVCYRTPPEVLAEWREWHGLGGFTDAAFAPWVERAWQDLHAEPTDARHLSRNADALGRGARALGWSSAPTARSVRDCANLGLCNLGCPSNAKQSTLLTHVPRALAKDAQLLTDSRVDRVLVVDGQVQGIEGTTLDRDTRRPVGSFRVDASVVCVAAGVMETPALLLRSGLTGRGSAGRDVQLHTSVHVAARFPEAVHGYYGPTMGYSVDELSDVHGRRGPGVMIENTAVYPIATASALPSVGAEHAGVMAALPYLARALVVIHDRTRGRIALARSGAPLLGYTPLAEDVERLRAGMVGAARVYRAAGAAEVFWPVAGVPPIRSDADLERLAGMPLDPSRFTLLYAVHLFGGAAMAGAADAGFCDEHGQAWDVRGLYVVDAAALPTNTGVNPQITIVANALRIASGIPEAA